MKNLLFIGGLTLLNVKINFLPSTTLMLVMSLMIILDFVTGIVKAVMLKKARTSQGYRKTIIKFMQYGGAVAISMVLSYIASKEPSMVEFTKYIDYLGNGLVIFIIFIEATSVLENLYQMDPESPFSKNFVKYLLLIMTFQLKNNPLSKLSTNTPDETRKEN